MCGISPWIPNADALHGNTHDKAGPELLSRELLVTTSRSCAFRNILLFRNHEKSAYMNPINLGRLTVSIGSPSPPSLILFRALQ
jgi:hypothetical protein